MNITNTQAVVVGGIQSQRKRVKAVVTSCVWLRSLVVMTAMRWEPRKRNEFGKGSVEVKMHTCWV